VIDTDAHPSGVVGNIVDPIGHGAAKFLDGKIMHPHVFGGALRAPLAPAILEIADQLFLLGIDRNRRLACRKRFLHMVVDVMKLRVAIRVVRSLTRLAVSLQAVIELVQQLANQCAVDLMAHRAQTLADLAQALACPQLRRLWIATRLRLNHRTQIIEQACVGLA
jgi:hypothetical protein